MEKAHTPGPWNMACDSYGKVQHSRKYDCVYTTLKGKKGDFLFTVAARIENSKDALLIAASPDLLAACEAFLATSPKERHNIDLECVIEAAIAKAKGA